MMLKRKQLQLKILKININSKKINVSFNSENKYYNAEYYLIKRGLRVQKSHRDIGKDISYYRT